MTTAALHDHSGADLRRGASLRPVPLLLPGRAGADTEARIRAALPLYRRLLEGAWTAQTAHPAYREQVLAHDPTGQCGVSSAWLVHQLDADFGVQATYCYGSLTIGDRVEVTIARHCWVEITCAADTFVIDLTADQAAGFDERIVFGAKQRLLSDHHLHYDARVRKSRQGLVDDDVWPRLVTLNKGIADSQYSLAHT